MPKAIDKLIINSPFKEPNKYWSYNQETADFELKDGRRPAGYYVLSRTEDRKQSDQGIPVEIDLVNRIRPRVDDWRNRNYPNVTRITKELLGYWRSQDVRRFPMFFCQIEAIETAIWLTEANDGEKQGLDIPKDADLDRLCFKLATGTGKTVVMAMIIAWQALNKIANLQDARFSKTIVVLAPGITVKDRLQVLKPEETNNYYQDFQLVPPDMWQDLLSAKVVVTNWHNLAPIKKNSGPKVIKKGLESDEAFVRRTLPEINGVKNILIINDEAHHCHRPDEDEREEEKEKATIWWEGLRRIQSARGMLCVFDLSATPFRPMGHNNTSEMLFPWIVSDFGLNDAIESGLVKTPRVAIRDDAQLTISLDNELRSKLFHIYPQEKENLNLKDESAGLPDLVKTALSILTADWLAKYEYDRQNSNLKIPPVLISICNSIYTSSRLYKHLVDGGFGVPMELQDASKIIRIDQDALDKIETGEDADLGSKKEQIIKERDKFNTVGKEGKPGQDIRSVIGVNMLSEGWDARNVSHILGLRAFASQLLCEQVVGRGLRRISYEIGQDGLFEPEYVTVFGVPFTILPVEGNEDGPPKPPPLPKIKVGPMPERTDKEIQWPNVLRAEKQLRYYLEFDFDKIAPLTLSAQNTPTLVDIAPVIDGRPNVDQISQISLDKLIDTYRFESEMVRAVAQLVERNASNWSGDQGHKFSQLYDLVKQFIESPKLIVKGPEDTTGRFRKILITLNMQKIVEHLQHAIHQNNKEEPVAIFDPVRPVRSTRHAQAWFTSKPVMPIKESQMSHLVADSEWEGRLAVALEQGRIKDLISWFKNDGHIQFAINYVFQGEYRTYWPDFIVKRTNNRYLIVEVKGQPLEQDMAKWAAAEDWVKAVNAEGKFGIWEFKILKSPDDIFEMF
jgi:type III restriction enzyme